MNRGQPVGWPDGANIAGREGIPRFHVLADEEGAGKLPVSQRLVVELVANLSQGDLDLSYSLDHMSEFIRCHGEGGIRPTQGAVQDEMLLYHAGAQGGGSHGDRLSQSVVG